MWRFLTGSFLVHLLVFGLAVVVERQSIWSYGSLSAGQLAFLLLAVPLATTAVVAELLHLVRPRRILVGRRRGTPALIALGVVTGAVGCFGYVVALAFLDRLVSDVILVAGVAALVAAATFAILPRRRHGRCLYCDYDLRGVLATRGGRCPECGAAPA